jgi:hypothetical protein
MRFPAYCLAGLLLAGFARAADSAPANTAAAAPTDFFNGKDVPAWGYINAQSAGIATVCSVSNGVLAVVGKPVGYFLLPGTPSGNYTFHSEYRWIKENPKNNGGVLVNISSGPVQQNTWPTCFQIQTKTQHAGDVIPMGGAKCAEVPAGKTQRDLQAGVSEKPTGQWNVVDVTRKGDALECTVNGVFQNRVTQCVPASGQIGFQLEGYPYEMRHITLTSLP